MNKKIPKGWKKVKLGDILEFKNGKVPPKVKGNFPIYGSNGILGYCNKFNYKGNTIIIGRVGICGSVYFSNTPIWISDNAFAVTLKEKSDYKYLYYFLKSLKLNRFALGSVQPLLTQSILKSIDIIICVSLQEQKAIANVLSCLDDKIELLHRQNKTLEAMAETLFRKWFIKDAKKDWERKKLGNFIIPKKGKNLKKIQAKRGIYPVIGGGINPSCYHNKCNTLSPVITISSSGANAGYIQIHHTPVWASDSSYIDYTVTPFIYFYYIFLKINQDRLYNKQEGSVQPHIYPKHLMDLDILDYPKSLIKKFEESCINLFKKIKHNQQQILTLEKLRDTLLPKLMTGEIRVKPK